ncbi:MAG TPA: copper resistance protein CopC, partial [Actinomycetota bacterium]|nr:copper resistance protein CopC [Actinomycetota bacterium]
MRKVTVCVLVAILGLVLTGPRAVAHAQYKDSNPTNGERLDEGPEAVTITWTEPPELSFTKVSVLDSSGQAYQAGGPEVLPDDHFTVRVPVDDMPDGAYTVTWRTVSKADGHSSSGAFSFGLGVEPDAVAASSGVRATIATPSASALEIIGRWGLLLGLVAVVGAGAVGALVNSGSAAVARLAIAGALVAAAGGIVFAEAQRRAAETGFSRLFETEIGRSLQYRGVLIAFCIAVAVSAYRNAGRLRVWLLWAAAIAAAATMLVHVEAGHASAITSWTWVAVGSQWVHFMAAGIWIGGLGALLLAIRGLEGDIRGRGVRRFSAMAGIMLAAVVVTGVVRSITEIDSWSELFSSGYGRAILIKVTLLGGLVGLGAVNRYRNVPQSSTSMLGLQRISRIEIGVASVVIAVAAVLASISPPADEAENGREPAPERVVATGSDFGTSVRVRLELAPGLPGPNEYSVRVTDYDTGEPVEATRVMLRFAFLDDPGVGQSELELESGRPGTYAGDGPNISLAGNWRIAITVQRGADSVEVPLELATRCRSQRLEEPGLAPVEVVDLGGGNVLQGY